MRKGIGTTNTAILASVGQSKDAKRTAVAHCIFNLSGAFLFIWLVKPYASLIQSVSPKGNEVDVIARQIANAHTGFNLTMTILWIPLIALMVKIVMKIVPDGNGKEKKQKYFKDALKELRKAVGVILDMYEEAMYAIISGKGHPKEKRRNHAFGRRNVVAGCGKNYIRQKYKKKYIFLHKNSEIF